MEIRDHNLLLLRLSSSFSTTRRADIPPQSISSISFFFFLSLAKKYTETESDRTGVSEMERSKEKGQAGGEKKDGPDICKEEERNWEWRREAERAIGRVFVLWSVSVDGDERSKHASPLSPWSVSMETLFLTLTHTVHCMFILLCAVFPAVSMSFKWTVWKSRVLIMSSFALTCNTGRRWRGIVWLPTAEHNHQTLKKRCYSS